MIDRVVSKFVLIVILLTPIVMLAQHNVNTEIRSLDSLCRVHMRTPDSLLAYAQKFLEYSQEHNLIEGKKKAFRYLGMANVRIGNFDHSNRYFHKALQLSKISGDKQLEVIVYNDLSINHSRTNYHDSSIYYSHKLIKHFKNDPGNKRLSLTYMNIGTNYIRKSNLDSAQFYLEKSIKGFKASQDITLMSNSLSLLGEVYFQKEAFQEALTISDSAQSLAESIDLQRNYSKNYALLARIHEKLNNIEKSEHYTQLSFENRPKQIDNKIVRDDGLNEDYKKSMYKFNHQNSQKLQSEKLFYKTNLFKVLFLTLGLLLVSFVLFKRNKKSNRELELLREKLNQFSESNQNAMLDLIHLNNKVVVDLNKLIYIKSEGHYLEFYLEDKDQPEIDRNSLINILEELPPQQFVRIHKSYIVNISHIKIINSTKLMLKSGKWINLSRTYKQQLRQMLNIE
ncbi:LytTR family transcriptional regulator DNA-binding domain-containing protein [Geojedonia litorea]|uniref:LytTR family transcriptional regulator DNA-binding domain-containing protein n=1 Tax=Geojedonia litorea TaxID=1268269 RepID=A0ABV9N309_9FLAO